MWSNIKTKEIHLIINKFNKKYNSLLNNQKIYVERTDIN